MSADVVTAPSGTKFPDHVNFPRCPRLRIPVLGIATCVVAGITGTWFVSTFQAMTWVAADQTLGIVLRQGTLRLLLPLAMSGDAHTPRLGSPGWTVRYDPNGRHDSTDQPDLCRTAAQFTIPLWLPIALIGLPALLVWFKRAVRRTCGACVHCGYRLYGIVNTKCPRCGRAARSFQRRLTRLLACVAVAVIALWLVSLRWSFIATGSIAGRAGRIGIEGGTVDAHWLASTSRKPGLDFRPTSLRAYQRYPDWSPEDVGLVKCPECIWGNPASSRPAAPPWFTPAAGSTASGGLSAFAAGAPPSIGPSYRAVMIPLWYFVAAAVCLMAVLTWRDMRRVPSGHCRRCRYNLRGNTMGICPECGRRARREIRQADLLAGLEAFAQR